MFAAAILGLVGSQIYGQGVQGHNNLGFGLTNISTWKKGIVSNITRESLFTIRTQADFEQYWVRSTGQRPQATPQGVDWNRQMLVAVHAGARRTGGYSIELAKSEISGNTILLHMRERVPGPNDIAPQMTTSPWVLIKLDHTPNDFRVDYKTATANEPLNGNGFDTYKFGGNTIRVPRGNSLPDCGWIGYYAGNYCEYDSPGIVIFDGETEFQSYWLKSLQLTSNQYDTSINWSQEKVISLHLGARNQPGYHLVVTGVRYENGRGVILAHEEKPPVIKAGRRTYKPVTILRVDRSVKNWTVEWQKP